MKQKRAIIVDLDGTLTNCEHRRHHVEKGKGDWHLFYSEMKNDTLNEWCKELILKIGYPVIIVTGRPFDYRQSTEDWLRKHEITYELMCFRGSGDFRQDAVVKEEILHQLILPKYEILFAIDDRKQVVDMWRKNGLICLQCDEGNF